MKSSQKDFLNKFFFGLNSGSGFKFRAIPETLFFIAVCLLINYLFFPDDMGYLNAALHPFWIIIILIPIRYGLVQGLISGVCAGGCYYLFAIFLQSDYSLTFPLLFILTAGILGQNRDVLDRRYGRLEDRLRIMSGKLDTFKKREDAYRETLGHFEQTIATQFSDAMDMFRELTHTKKMSPEEMKQYLLVIVKKFLNADKCAYFEIEDDACYKIYEGTDKKQIHAVYPIGEDIILMEAYRTGQFAYLHLTTEQDMNQYDKYKCLLAGCLFNPEGEIMGLVGIESLPFSSFNAQSFKLFSSLLEFWSGAINDKSVLEKTREKNIIDEVFHIYKYNYFTRRIEQEFERAREFAIPLSISLLCLTDIPSVPEEKRNEIMAFFITNIKKFTTELDMICHYREPGMIAVIQPFHLYADAEKKIKAIVTEVESYNLTPYKEKTTPLSLVYAGGDFRVGMESCGDFIQSIEKELSSKINP